MSPAETAVEDLDGGVVVRLASEESFLNLLCGVETMVQQLAGGKMRLMAGQERLQTFRKAIQKTTGS